MLPCAETALICKFKEQLPYMNNYDLIIVGAGPGRYFYRTGTAAQKQQNYRPAHLPD